MMPRYGFRQRGLTLIELMISLAIALFLLAIISQVFLSAKSGFRFQNNASRMQENARFAIDAMVRDVRDAGYAGCGMALDKEWGLANVVNRTTAGDWWTDFTWISQQFADAGIPTAHGIQGFDNGTGFPTDLSGTPTTPTGQPKPDALIVRYAELGSERLVASHDGTSMVTSTPHGFRQGEVLVATKGCTKSAVFQMTNVSSGASETTVTNAEGSAGVSPGNCSKNLMFGPCNGASKNANEPGVFNCPQNSPCNFTGGSLMRLVSKAYYLAPASGTTDGTNSLWVRSFPGSNPVTGQPDTYELLRGVQNMQIRYGFVEAVTTAPYSASSFITADQVGNRWDRVVAAQIELLLRSEEAGVATSPMSLPYAGQTFTAAAGDNRLYRTYSFTVNLRNRVK